MEMVPDYETEGFTFIWTIQNFSYCLQKNDEPLSSPSFKLNLLDANEWFIKIYPRGKEEDDRFHVFLHVLSSGPFPIEVKPYFSIRAKNGTFKTKRNESLLTIFEKECGLGDGFLTQCELRKKGDDGFLENDTLTLRCRITKDSPDHSVSGQCYARTVIDVKRITFVWNLENFKELHHNGKKNIIFHTASSKNQSFKIDIFLCGEVYNEKKIQVEIKQNSPYQKSFMNCKLSLLDVVGKIDQSVRGEHWFEDSKEMLNWYLPLMPANKVLENEKLYLVNGALSLRCEFAVSSGAKYSEVERTEYAGLEKLDKKCSNTSFPGSLKDNLPSFYKEGKFGNLIIRSDDENEFPVHKDILCARSEVFRAMFERDTKEKRTGVIEIGDLNYDTVSKMLLFIYADILEDLEWEVASELYLAADKYKIVALKRECSNFFKGNLNSSNVCEVLVLADMYHDLEMKSYAQDFFIDHATEIINSEYWKKFIKDIWLQKQCNFNV